MESIIQNTKELFQAIEAEVLQSQWNDEVIGEFLNKLIAMYRKAQVLLLASKNAIKTPKEIKILTQIKNLLQEYIELFLLLDVEDKIELKMFNQQNEFIPLVKLNQIILKPIL